LARPWDFALEDIRVPVQLWRGDEDTVIPMHQGQYLASVIPGATLRICPGEAHMLMWNDLGERIGDRDGVVLEAPFPVERSRARSCTQRLRSAAVSQRVR